MKYKMENKANEIGNKINKIENIYKISSGFCLIINIINFEGNQDWRRDG